MKKQAALTSLLRWAMPSRCWPVQGALQALSDRLPAVCCAGLEIRLDGDEAAPIDLQVGIRGPDDAGRLTAWLEDMEAAGCPRDWGRLRDAVRGGLLELPFQEFWLEVDGGGSRDWPPLSLFVRFPDAPCEDVAGDRVSPWLERLGLPMTDHRRQGLDRVLASCAPGQRLTHLGCMLGREGAPLRLVVEGVAWDGIAGFLRRAGWEGDEDALSRTCDGLLAHFDRLRLALDLDEDGAVALPVGLECFLGTPATHDVRWQRVLESLASRGLCGRFHGARVLSWPGTLTPARSPDWPEVLLVDALAGEPGPPRWVQRRISHVKVTFDGQGACRPKAYVGFVDTHSPGATSARPSPSPARMASRPDADARTAARQFLLDARTPAGAWLDYPGFVEGISDEWVTAFVAHALAEDGSPIGRGAAARAWTLLALRDRDGWGWNLAQPADADSTAWALRLATRLGHPDHPRAARAQRFLERHARPDGSVATYDRDHFREWAGHASVSADWFEGHACVTAAAAALPMLADRACAFLRDSQAPDGSWQAYWWPDPAYATALGIEALSRQAQAGDETRMASARTWAERRLASALDTRQATGAFAIAWLLRLVRCTGTARTELVEGAHRWLRETQRPDGSWDASALMAIPNAAGRRVPALDQHRLLTTASALLALGDAGG